MKTCLQYFYFLLTSYFFCLFIYADDADYTKYAMFASNAERPKSVSSIITKLPLKLEKNARIALVGNTLFDRMRDYGHFEALIHEGYPNLEIVVRNLAWSADEIDLQPRPDNFADTEQHLTAMKADVIIAAFGFNELFAGPKEIPYFEERLDKYLTRLTSKAYNGQNAP